MKEMLFYAFEVATYNGYYAFINRWEHNRDNHLEKLLVFLTGYAIDTIAIGTVTACTFDEGLEKVRVGNWEYSQRN